MRVAPLRHNKESERVMPNWCWNDITITGKTERIEQLRADAKGPSSIEYKDFREDFGDKEIEDVPIEKLEQFVKNPAPYSSDEIEFSFHKLVPLPESTRCFPYDDRRTEKICDRLGIDQVMCGYNAEYALWGTKWGADFEVNEIDTGHPEYSGIHLCGETAWGPADEFFIRVSKAYPDLFIQVAYNEPGVGFTGEFQVVDGNIQHQFVKEHDEGLRQAGERIPRKGIPLEYEMSQ